MDWKNWCESWSMNYLLGHQAGFARTKKKKEEKTWIRTKPSPPGDNNSQHRPPSSPHALPHDRLPLPRPPSSTNRRRPPPSRLHPACDLHLQNLTRVGKCEGHQRKKGGQEMDRTGCVSCCTASFPSPGEDEREAWEGLVLRKSPSLVGVLLWTIQSGLG